MSQKPAAAPALLGSDALWPTHNGLPKWVTLRQSFVSLDGEERLHSFRRTAVQQKT